MDLRFDLDYSLIDNDIIRNTTPCVQYIYFKLYVMFYDDMKNYSHNNLYDNNTEQNIIEYFDLDDDESIDNINEWDNCDLENLSKSMIKTTLDSGIISKYNVALLSQDDINIYCNMYHTDNIIEAIKIQNQYIDQINKKLNKNTDNTMFISRGYNLLNELLK